MWSTKHEKLLAPIAAGSSHTSPPEIQERPKSLSPEKENEASADTSADVQQASPPNNETSSPPKAEYSVIQPRSRPDTSNLTDSLSAIRQQLHRSTVPEFLLHLPTMLVEYYFNYVCQIFSCFDGTLNPFRSTVGRLWDGSAPIYYAIQSMAAAYLSNHFPRMNQVGIQMQRETYRCLYQNQGAGEENLDKSLLTVLLVGQTTAWHNPKDLGLVHLQNAKLLNRRRIEQQGNNAGIREQRQNKFFEQCILYWDMLAGFVDDHAEGVGLPGFENTGFINSPDSSSASSPPGVNQPQEKIFPHPWTGVAPQAQKLFAQVGRLIRAHKKNVAQDAASLDFLSLDLSFDLGLPQSTSTQALETATILEEELLSFEPPPESSLVDAGDENTPLNHYILLAEAFRCAALLQIYRVFPSILQLRVPGALNDFSSPPQQEFTIPQQKQFKFLPLNPLQPPSDFLLSLALHTISLLEQIPTTSGTRCLQPIILISTAPELHFSNTSSLDPLSFLSSAPQSGIFNSITNKEIDIADARRFVTTRFQEFCLGMPAKPLKMGLGVIEETWRRVDGGEEGIFWMDVMEGMGGGTIFG